VVCESNDDGSLIPKRDEQRNDYRAQIPSAAAPTKIIDMAQRAKNVLTQPGARNPF
jgi:hypothetical protein